MGGCSFAPHSLLQRPPHKKKALALPSKCLTQKQRWNHLTGSTPHLTGFTPFLQIKWWIKNQWNPSWLPLQQKKISPINFKVASCHPPSSSHHPIIAPSDHCSSSSNGSRPSGPVPFSGGRPHVMLPVKSVGLKWLVECGLVYQKTNAKFKKKGAKNKWQSQPSQPSIWKAFLILLGI